jgi:hypothetical protein
MNSNVLNELKKSDNSDEPVKLDKSTILNQLNNSKEFNKNRCLSDDPDTVVDANKKGLCDKYNDALQFQLRKTCFPDPSKDPNTCPKYLYKGTGPDNILNGGRNSRNSYSHKRKRKCRRTLKKHTKKQKSCRKKRKTKNTRTKHIHI